MIEPNDPPLDVEQLIQWVRQEAAQRQPHSADPQPMPAPRQWLYSLGELLRYDDVEFVTHIYRCILQREPDPDGLQDGLHQLRNGEISKIDQLRNLRFSPEGERVGVKVQGLLSPAESLSAPMLDVSSELPIKDRYTLDELLQYRDEAFVRNAYRALLHREPDESGLAHHLNQLRRGLWTRLEIIQGLWMGPEGRTVAVDLVGWTVEAPPDLPSIAELESPVAVSDALLADWTADAPLMEEGQEPPVAISSPSPGDKIAFTLSELLEPSDQAFVTYAYRALLRREPDAVGERYHLQRLRAGQSTKVQVLGQLRYSREGRQVGIAVNGLWLPFVLQTAYRLPVIGDILALATLLLRPRSLITRLRQLEAHEDQFRAKEALQDARVNQLKAFQDARVNQLKAFQDARMNQLSMLLQQHRAEIITQTTHHQRLATELTRLQQVVDLQAGALELVQVKQGVNELTRQIAAELAQIKGLVDTKANGIESDQWQHHVHRLEQDKASVVDLAEVRQALVANLEQAWQVLAGKAEAVNLEQAWQVLAGKAEAVNLEQAWQVLAGKAEAVNLEQAWQVLAGKIDTTDVQKELNALQERVAGELNPIRQQLYDYRRNLTDQQRRLSILLEEARKRLPAPFDEQQLSTLVREQDHLLDAIYVSFEDHFRGTRNEIRQRLLVYLPHLHQAGIGTSDSPVLDIGCGRGEWLELLAQEGLIAQGIDLNQTMVEECRERGLVVDQAEALACLRALPDASLGAVTGLHIIEHLPLAVLIGLLDEALRVVRPGGLVIFETPNPENLMVSAYNFYFDPTHRNPLPPLLSSFLLEGRGWTPVEILRLNPYPEHQRFSTESGSSQVTSWLNEVFCGPQDYAVIGHKP